MAVEGLELVLGLARDPAPPGAAHELVLAVVVVSSFVSAPYVVLLFFYDEIASHGERSKL